MANGFCKCGRKPRLVGQRNCDECHKIASREYRKRKRFEVKKLKDKIRLLQAEVRRLRSLIAYHAKDLVE